MGFDTEGLVIAEGPEFEIENAKALAKAGNDPKKLKKVKRKKAPEGFVTWNENTFDKLIDADPETLVPHMKVTHSMVLNEVAQGGDARYRIDRLIDDSAQTPEQKERLHDRADEIFQTLFEDVYKRQPIRNAAIKQQMAMATIPIMVANVQLPPTAVA